MQHEDDESDARALVMQFFYSLDKRDHKKVASLFAPQGVWHRQGRVFKGEAAIFDTLQDRPENRVTAHLVSNFRVVPASDAELRLCYYLTAFESVVDADGKASVPALVGILESTDDILRIDGEMRLARKASVRLLPPP